ncbi:MAG: tetratricopeptide repeat protein [Nitrospirota bacterium]
MAIDKNSVVKEAQKYIAKGQFDKAIAEWKKLLRESPADSNIYNTIGDLCLKKDAKAEAVDAYKKAADILAADGFTSKAIALYKKILNIDKQNVEIHQSLGDLNAEKGLTGAALESYKVIADYYTHKHDNINALRIFQKMADLNPSNLSFRIKLGDMYAKEGMKPEAGKAYLDAADAFLVKNEFQEARLLFEKVLSLDPQNKDVYHRAGLIYLKEGKFVEACKALKPVFENNPSNEEVAEAYLEALAQAGKHAESAEALARLVEHHPEKAGLHEKLFASYCALNEKEKAGHELTLLVQQNTAHGNHVAAEKLLDTFVSTWPQSVWGRRKRAEFYTSHSRVGEAAQEFLDAGDLLLGQGDREEATTFFELAIKLSPDMIEAQKRINQLHPALSAPPPVEQPSQPDETVETPAYAPQPDFSADGEDAALNDAFTEADVLMKYGLSAKAIEQLEALLERYPESIKVHTRLRDLYCEAENIDMAIKHVLAVADIYMDQGKTDCAEAELQFGFEIAPRHPVILARLGKSAVLDESDGLISSPPETPASFFEETSPFAENTPETADVPDTEISPLDNQESYGSGEGQDIIAFDQPVFDEQPEIKEPSLQPEIEEQSTADAELSELWAEAEFYYQQGLFDEAKKHYTKIIERVPGDQRVLNRLAELSREEEETREFTKLAEAVEGLEDNQAYGTEESRLPASVSDEEALQRLMREIGELHQGQASAAPSPTVPSPSPPKQPLPTASSPARPPQKSTEKEDEFFDFGAELQKEVASASPRKSEKTYEDFFDLAAELRDELSTTQKSSRASVPLENQSLDDIFEEFKKGVEKHSLIENTDTHYNLGVAYKEMGLLDDAIAEFIMSPEGEPWFVQSRYMLGLCYMEKGDFQNAISEIQNALNYSRTKEIDVQDRICMQYDLGLAYQSIGNIKAAINELQKVAEVNPDYQGTAAKLKELRKGEFVSLEQLKDDIEKEISSKFLEEGERIEREERNRRNEKIRN